MAAGIKGAGVAELVDASNLELAALDKRAGSNPVPGIQVLL